MNLRNCARFSPRRTGRKHERIRETAKPMKQILKDALKIPELESQLSDVDTADGNCKLEDFSDYHVAKEADWKLICYVGDDTLYAQELNGEWGNELMLEARKNVRMLKAFVKKYPKDKQNREGKTIE